jgi:hypothetical protein
MRARVLLLLFLFADIRTADPHPSVRSCFELTASLPYSRGKEVTVILQFLVVRALIQALYPEFRVHF